jgi:hypothetical protein
MNAQAPRRRDVQLMFAEMRRYLSTVELFRAEGCEPHWQPERDRFAPVQPDKH